MNGSHVLLGVTGSIAAYKSADLVVDMVKGGAQVTVIMTESARKFIAPLTFETLSQRPVVADMWDRAQYPDPVHIKLAEWADLLVVAPATASFIGKLAHGIADDMLSCMSISVECPTVIAPAMNDVMYRHPAVKANVALLKKRGCVMVGPARGRLASGKTGLGRLAASDKILDAVRLALPGKRVQQKR